jgi:hypothetical protein
MAVTARIVAVWSVLQMPLKWLAKTFGGSVVGHLADLAWNALVNLFS